MTNACICICKHYDGMVRNIYILYVNVNEYIARLTTYSQFIFIVLFLQFMMMMMMMKKKNVKN